MTFGRIAGIVFTLALGAAPADPERTLGAVPLRTDGAWTHLVLTKENGQVLRIPRGDIASLEYLAGKPEEVDLGGEWMAQSPGSRVPVRYRVSQEGTALLWTCHVRGEQGKGTLEGRGVEAAFEGDEGAGKAQGRVMEVDVRGHAQVIRWKDGTTWTRMTLAQAREFGTLSGTWVAGNGTEYRFTQEGANLYWFAPAAGERGRATLQGRELTGLAKQGGRTTPVEGRSSTQGSREVVRLEWKDGEVLQRVVKPGDPLR